MQNLKWIFFDIGSTLVDESRCYEKRFAEMTDGTSVSIEAFKAKVVEFSKKNLKGDKAAAAYFGLQLTRWHCEEERLYSEVSDVLSALKKHGYNLGIIANQLPGADKRLENMGVSDFFSVIVCSSDEGIAKPDTEIFQRALNRAHCSPENAVMVGDRLDNDIVPAKSIGMKTVWIKQGLGKYAEIRNTLETPDIIVENLTELLKYFV